MQYFIDLGGIIKSKEKKSEISTDFLAIFRLSAEVGKKNPWKNRLKKFRRKISDFSEKIGKIPTFGRFFGVWSARRRSASGGDFFADFLAIN